MNPYFYFPTSAFRFVPRSKARAEDANARFDEVSYGFDLVAADITNLLSSKAPLLNPDFTGVPTLAGEPLATQAYARSLAFAASLPIAAGDKGKVGRVNGAGLGEWGDWWGPAVTLTVANNGQTLALRTLYLVDASGGAFAVNLPLGMAAGDWLKFADITPAGSGGLVTNNVTLNSNGNGNFRDGDTTLILDVNNDSFEVVKTATGVREQ